MEMSQHQPTSSFLFLEARREGEWGFELCRDLRFFFFSKHKYSAYSARALSSYIFPVFHLLSVSFLS